MSVGDFTQSFLPVPVDRVKALFDFLRNHQSSFLPKYKFAMAAKDVPTINRKEIALMTGVLPSRT